MTLDNAVGRVLAWDSEFWGITVGEILDLSGTSDTELEEWLTTFGIDCAYLRISSAKSDEIQRAEGLGFRLADIRVDLGHMSHPDAVEGIAKTVRVFDPSDLDTLREVARSAHTDSRFYSDQHFPRGRCDDFYDAWITNSTTGFADVVLVSGPAGAPTGYITCKVDGASGRIGLVAVADSARGQGVGVDMVTSAISWFASQGVARVYVATQGANAGAQRLYQRCGFAIHDIAVTLHRWTKS